jgi:hypothetical protein
VIRTLHDHETPSPRFTPVRRSGWRQSHSTSSTLDSVLRERGLTIDEVADFYSGTKGGHELMKRARAKGMAQGLAEVRAQSLAEGKAEVVVLMLEILLRDRFGEDPRIEATAKRLAETTDPAAAVHAITHAATIDELQA